MLKNIFTQLGNTPLSVVLGLLPMATPSTVHRLLPKQDLITDLRNIAIYSIKFKSQVTDY
jgi:hypothetical protein